jgi:hypothetical protein
MAGIYVMWLDCLKNYTSSHGNDRGELPVLQQATEMQLLTNSSLLTGHCQCLIFPHYAHFALYSTLGCIVFVFL